MINLRMSILNALLPITKAIGEMHLPFTRKKVTGRHVFDALPHLEPGAILLSSIDGEVTNLFIKGDFTHTAIFSHYEIFTVNGKLIEIPYVVEAIGYGVVLTDLITFMTKKDRVAALYPRGSTKTDRARAAIIARSQVGKEYDYLFEPGAKAFYCSELIQYAYDQVIGGFDFTRRDMFGVSTVNPQDYYDAKGKMRVAWDSSGSIFA